MALSGLVVTASLTSVQPPTAVGEAIARSTPSPCSRGLVALTFDDGPSTKVTGPLLRLLVQRHVPATFFVVGQRVAAAPDLVRRAARHGFTIGNHTFEHQDLTALSDAGITSTIRHTARLIRRAGVRPSRLVRPPYGATNSRVRSILAGMELTPVMWDIDSRDWESGEAATIAARVLGSLRPHDSNIVLLHDGVLRSPITLAAVPTIIARARSRGYCFAPLGPRGTPIPPVPSVRIRNATVREGDPGDGGARLKFTIGLDQPTSRRVSVRVRDLAVTASASTDYRPISRRVVFEVGSIERQITVIVRNDVSHERLERFWVRLNHGSHVRIADGLGLGAILDNDPVRAPKLHEDIDLEALTGVRNSGS